MPAFHSALHHEFLDSAQCCCRCEKQQGQSKRCNYQAPWLLTLPFQDREWVVSFPWEKAFIHLLQSPICSSISAGSDCTSEETERDGTLLLEPTAAGRRPLSNSQLLGNMLWGQAGAFQQLYAMPSESCNKQVQTLLLDFGNCCLRDRFAYKYPLFSLWLFIREAGKKKGSLLLQNLPAPAVVVASSHLSSSSSLFQPLKF